MSIFYRKSIGILLTLVCFLAVTVSPVLAATVKSTMTISGFSVAGPVTFGQAYFLSGKISSNLNISSVTINITNTSNVIETGKTITCSGGTKSFDIRSKIDSYISFSKLSVGTKKIVVSATDAAGAKILYTQSFNIVKPTYNRINAVKYALAHWNDGVGLCAQFVSACLNAGGLTGCGNNLCTTLFNNITNTQKLGKVVPANQAVVGDLVFWGSAIKGHTAIISKIDSSGIWVAQHNNAQNYCLVKTITPTVSCDKIATYVHMN